MSRTPTRGAAAPVDEGGERVPEPRADGATQAAAHDAGGAARTDAGGDAPATATDAAARSSALRTVAWNAVSLLLAYVLPRAFTLAGIVVAARVLGAATFGAYGTAAAFAVILSIVATLGMMPLLIREIARSPGRAPALLRAAHRVKTVANLLMLGALFALAAWVLAYPPEVVGAALLLGIAYAIGAYAENLAAYFQAIERMHVWTQASAAYGLVTGALGAVLVLTTGSVVWFCVAPIAGQITALAWLLARAPDPVRRGAAVDPGDVLRLVRALAPFAAAFIALTIYYKVDVLLLARWRPAADVGVYTAAYKLVDAAQALAIVAAGAVYPRLSRAAPAAGDGARWAGTRTTELMVLGAVPAAALLWLLRAPIIAVLYGEAYSAAAAVLALLTAALPALALNILAGYVLGAAGHMAPVAVAYAVGAAANIALNAALIPALGPVGAATAMLVTETLLALALLAVLRSRAGAAPAVRPLVAAFGAAAACAVLALLPVGPVAAALVYLPVVAVLYHRVRVVSPAEGRAVRTAVAGALRDARGAGASSGAGRST